MTKLKKVKGNLELTELVEPTYRLVYRIPLSKNLQAWATSDLEQFIRKYAQLTMTRLPIISVAITWEGIKNDK